MNSSLHRTDVDYVWPDALVRPSGALLVYLDLNHWINLAKADVEHPAGGPYRDALAELRRAGQSGRAVFPISLAHLMELSKVSRRQRIQLATVMEELSGFTSLIARALVLNVELEAVLNEVTDTVREVRQLDVVAHGMPYAFGRQGRFRISNGRRDVTEEVRAEIGPEEFDRRFAQAYEDLDRGILRGPTSDEEESELRTHGWNPEIAFEAGSDRAQFHRQLAAGLSDKTMIPDDPTDYRRERVRDVLRLHYVTFEMIEMVTESLSARGLAIEDVWSDRDASQRLVDAMPSGDVAVTLFAQYHRDPTFRWEPNHIFDIDALSVAVPYCDLVATDRQAADAMHRHGIPERTQTHVVRNLDDLVDLIV